MKPVRLATCRTEFANDSRRLLLQVARQRPESVAILMRVDGQISTAVCGLNRLEMLGALQALAIESWSAE